METPLSATEPDVLSTPAEMYSPQKDRTPKDSSTCGVQRV